MPLRSSIPARRCFSATPAPPPQPRSAARPLLGFHVDGVVAAPRKHDFTRVPPRRATAPIALFDGRCQRTTLPRRTRRPMRDDANLGPVCIVLRSRHGVRRPNRRRSRWPPLWTRRMRRTRKHRWIAALGHHVPIYMRRRSPARGGPRLRARFGRSANIPSRSSSAGTLEPAYPRQARLPQMIAALLRPSPLYVVRSRTVCR